MYHFESRLLEDSDEYEIRIRVDRRTPVFCVNQVVFFEDKEVKVRISAVKRKVKKGHGKKEEVKESVIVSAPREAVQFEEKQKEREVVLFQANQANQSGQVKPKKHKKNGLSKRSQSHKHNIKSVPKKSQKETQQREMVTFHKTPQACPPRAARQPRGLKNLGNSCYVNSILQCLNAASPFVSALLNKTYVVNAASRGDIIGQMSALVSRMRSEENEVDPSGLMEKVRTLAPQFENTKQNDARSFLLSLLDFLHEDVKHPRQAIQVAASEPEEWIEETPETSFLNENMNGMVKYSMNCEGKQVEEKELFSVLSLPVPQGGRPQLEDLFDFVERDCFECMQRHKAKVELIRKPPVWMLHLDRFSEKEKIETNVVYQKEMKGYRLQAVVHHEGSLVGGHYWAQVRMAGEWFVCDDGRVEGIEEREVGSSNTAYMLFYVKC